MHISPQLGNKPLSLRFKSGSAPALKMLFSTYLLSGGRSPYVGIEFKHSDISTVTCLI